MSEEAVKLSVVINPAFISIKGCLKIFFRQPFHLLIRLYCWVDIADVCHFFQTFSVISIGIQHIVSFPKYIFSHDFSGYTRDNAVVGKTFFDHRMRTDNTATADLRTAKNCRAVCYPNTVANGNIFGGIQTLAGADIINRVCVIGADLVIGSEHAVFANG